MDVVRIHHGMCNGTNLYGYGIAIDSNCRNVFLSCSVGRARDDLFHGLAAAGRGTSLCVEFQNHTSALLTFEKSDCHSDPFPALSAKQVLNISHICIHCNSSAIKKKDDSASSFMHYCTQFLKYLLVQFCTHPAFREPDHSFSSRFSRCSFKAFASSSLICAKIPPAFFSSLFS